MSREYDVEEHGIIYHVKEFSNGAVMKYIKTEPGSDSMKNVLTNEQQAQFEMQANIQYLADLAEINMEV